MIDIIIPAYNCSKTLGRALASLAAQTDDDFTCTIVDDCSTENLEGIVETYRSLLKDLRYIRKEVNGGAGMARQTGIDNTDGEWIAFLDSDDVYMPYTVEVFKLIIKNNPDMNLLHSTFLQQQIVDGKHGYISMAKGYTWMHGKIYRREFIEKYGIRFKPEFANWADDSNFNSQCSELTDTVINELPMYVWTDTAGSLTRADPNAGRKKLDTLMRAMIDSAESVLRYKNEIGHLKNTINNIDEMIRVSETPLTDQERDDYNRLVEIYQKHGIKPTPQPQKRRGIFRR